MYKAAKLLQSTRFDSVLTLLVSHVHVRKATKLRAPTTVLSTKQTLCYTNDASFIQVEMSYFQVW